MGIDLHSAIDKIKNGAKSDNANIRKSPMQKMLSIGGLASKKHLIEVELPKDIAEAFQRGDIHIHDADFYDTCLTCLQIPLGKMLAKGFNTGNGTIRPPRRIRTAIDLTAILIQSEQNDQFGGVSIPNLEDLAPYVQISRERYSKVITRFAKRLFFQYGISKINKEAQREIDREVENLIEAEICQGMEALVHNLNTMHSRAGSQVPFSSVNLGVGTSHDERLIIRYFLKAFNNGLGNGETPLFPQVVFKIKDGISLKPSDPNFDLLMLSLQVSARRMNPNYLLCDTSYNKQYDPWKLATMGCRTRVIANRHGEATSHGRGNLSFTTINLPRLALKSIEYARNNEELGMEHEDVRDYFFFLLNDMMKLSKRQLLHRYNRQAQLRVEDLPFMMGQGLYVDSENLKRGDFIKEAIKNGTLSIGFIGIAEVCQALLGDNHANSKEVLDFADKVVEFMREKCDQYSEEHDLNFTLLATPAEGLADRFVMMDKEIYGVVEGVTDRDYYTNSNHVPVWQKISPFRKAEIEGRFHKYTNAGHIFYIEFDAPPLSNESALLDMINHCLESDIGYMGFNFPIDFCKDCHLEGVFNGKCPSCHSDGIIMTRRVTGYLGTLDNFAHGKEREANDRVSHIEVTK